MGCSLPKLGSQARWLSGDTDCNIHLPTGTTTPGCLADSCISLFQIGTQVSSSQSPSHPHQNVLFCISVSDTTIHQADFLHSFSFLLSSLNVKLSTSHLQSTFYKALTLVYFSSLVVQTIIFWITLTGTLAATLASYQCIFHNTSND